MTPETLKHHRKTLGLSQQELADLLGVHILTVSKWERGTHKINRRTETAIAALDRPAGRPRKDVTK